MNSYIIISEKRIIIQEGWSSPQYQYLGIIMKIVCFLLGMICFDNHTYPRKGLCLDQMFPGLSIDHIKKGIIKVKRDEKDTLFYSGMFGCTIY
jgi:hypothetical protein